MSVHVMHEAISTIISEQCDKNTINRHIVQCTQQGVSQGSYNLITTKIYIEKLISTLYIKYNEHTNVQYKIQDDGGKPASSSTFITRIELNWNAIEALTRNQCWFIYILRR